MRLVLALALSALGATTAAAQAAGDRYGFASSPHAVADAPDSSAQPQRALTWARKTVPTRAAAPAATTPHPGPSAEAAGEVAGYGANRSWLPPPPAAPRWRPAAYQPFTPQAPYQPPQQVAVLTPPAARAFAPPPAAALASRSPGAAHTPMPDLAGGPRPSAPAPQVAQNGGAAVHYYSVHRGYGLTPDAIPEPPRDQGYVLIGPSDTASAPSDRDRPRGDDDDDARRDAPF